MIALDALGGIPLTFKGPGKHGLTTPLADGTQIDEGRRAGDTDFFGELTTGSIQTALTRFDFALGNGPDPVIPVREPRTARVRDEHFQSTAVKAVH
jgi:hypothetical protein